LPRVAPMTAREPTPLRYSNVGRDERNLLSSKSTPDDDSSESTSIRTKTRRPRSFSTGN
jgi:hypothetical protein